MLKIINGEFFTERDVFEDNIIFEKFMKENDLWNKNILEPFAGCNNLIKFLQKKNKELKYKSFDINPRSEEVIKNDSINNWNYKNFDLIITNPPYLSKHRAKKMKLNINFFNFDDLYKISLYKCISNIRFTIAIIPTTLINSNRKEDKKIIEKLVIFQLLPNKKNFSDTEHPVALAYFDNTKKNNDFLLYENNYFISSYNELLKKQEQILKSKNDLKVFFNKKNGNICINTCDNQLDNQNIKFLDSNWLPDTNVKNTNRHKVKIFIENICISKKIIFSLNKKIKELRINKCDYLWTSFKNVSNTGHFRKRLSFGIIRKIINSIDIDEKMTK